MIAKSYLIGFFNIDLTGVFSLAFNGHLFFIGIKIAQVRVALFTFAAFFVT